MRNKLTSLVLTLAMAVTGFGLVGSRAHAAATLTTPATASVSADSASGASVALPAMVITEGAAGDIAAGTYVFTLPTGFVFDTTSVSNIAYSGTGLAGDASVNFPSSTTMSFAVSAASTSAGSITIGSTTPIKVKASAGTPLASGNITLTTGTVTGLAAGTSFGALTEVPGAATKLAFTVQPPATAAIASAFSATVAVEDQFGNVLANDSGRAITISATPATGTTGTLSGTLNMNDASGLAAYTDLAFSGAGSITLAASATGLTGATSNAVSLSATAPTTPPLILFNGELVQVQGSLTVYMVVNGTLRPFTSEALFHARGKKFQNIQMITAAQFAQLTVGAPIGKSDDDDIDTPDHGGHDGHDGNQNQGENEGEDHGGTATPPTIPPTTPPVNPLPTGTLPSAAGLPDGTLVKLANNPTVFQVSGGQLMPFTSAFVFFANGHKFQDVHQTQSLGNLPVGSPVAVPDGTLVQGNGPTVFVMMGGKKLGIPSPSVLSEHGWSFKNVVKVNNNDLKNIDDGGVED